MSTPLLAIEGLTKSYPGVIANDDVSMAIGEGEIHALLGENGAGKSTLVKAIYGLIRPDQGRMTWRGKPYAPAAPHEARASGVAMVFQHFSLFDALDVAENVALGMDKPPPIRQLAARIAQVSSEYGLPLDPQRLVGDLSAGERQRVEIIRCLLQNPDLLIMDEPTSVLTPQEVEILFQTLRKLRAEGRSILYISHKLDEIRALCETATILRLGRVVASCDPRAETTGSLARMMVGSAVAELKRARAEAAAGPVRLKVDNLDLPSEDPQGTSLKSVALEVCAGEILGIAGVAGNGQDELFAALSGEARAPEAGNIVLEGAPIGWDGINRRRRRSAAFVPEERLGHAAAPRMALSENALVAGHAANGFVRRGFVSRPKMLGWVDAVTRAFDVRKGPRDPEARALSGGNLQKFVVGREILRKPKLLVVSQPTWGVDAGAASLIRQALIDLAAEGASVLVISQDLDELFEISDRIAVIFHGRLSPAQPSAALTREAVGLLMGGEGFGAEPAPALQGAA